MEKEEAKTEYFSHKLRRGCKQRTTDADFRGSLFFSDDKLHTVPPLESKMKNKALKIGIMYAL